MPWPGQRLLLATILDGDHCRDTAFLDDVTTMLLMIPVTIKILAGGSRPYRLHGAEGLRLLISVVPPPSWRPPTSSSVPTPDPDLRRVVVTDLIYSVLLVVTVFYFLSWRRKLSAGRRRGISRTIEYLKERSRITDHKLMTIGLITLAFTIFLFIIHGSLHMEPSGSGPHRGHGLAGHLQSGYRGDAGA